LKATELTASNCRSSKSHSIAHELLDAVDLSNFCSRCAPKMHGAWAVAGSGNFHNLEELSGRHAVAHVANSGSATKGPSLTTFVDDFHNLVGLLQVRFGNAPSKGLAAFQTIRGVSKFRLESVKHCGTSHLVRRPNATVAAKLALARRTPVIHLLPAAPHFQIADGSAAIKDGDMGSQRPTPMVMGINESWRHNTPLAIKGGLSRNQEQSKCVKVVSDMKTQDTFC